MSSEDEFSLDDDNLDLGRKQRIRMKTEKDHLVRKAKDTISAGNIVNISDQTMWTFSLHWIQRIITLIINFVPAKLALSTLSFY